MLNNKAHVYTENNREDPYNQAVNGHFLYFKV